ncbi:hypothetical protein ACVBKF_06550, partial [Shewanella sp. 0m-11]
LQTNLSYLWFQWPAAGVCAEVKGFIYVKLMQTLNLKLRTFRLFVICIPEATSSICGSNGLQPAYVQTLLKRALRHPWPLCGFIPETEGFSCIYTRLKSRINSPMINGSHPPNLRLTLQKEVCDDE